MSYLVRLYNLFLTRKTTALLIVTLTSLYLLGAIIPQKQLVGSEAYSAWRQTSPQWVSFLESLQLTSIYSSPLVLAMTILFFIHLVIVTLKRVPALLKELRLPERVNFTAESVERFEPVTVRNADAAAMVVLKEAVAARGYRIVHGDNCFKGFKNQFSMFGSLMFHLSFLLILLGAMVIFYSRFSGDAYVAEQQGFSGRSEEYRKRMRYSGLRKSLPDLQFQVEKIEPRFAGLEPLSLNSKMIVTYGGRTVRGTCDVNHPFRSGPLSILITDLEATPLLRIVRSDGRELLTAFALLKILRGQADTFEIPDSPYSLSFRFWPDYALDASGKAMTLSYELKNPHFEVAVYRDGKLLSNGKLLATPQDYLDFDGLRLTIPEIHYYGNFLIVEERGGVILSLGFLVAVGGLILKVFWRRKAIYVVQSWKDGTALITLARQTEYYQEWSSELDEIAAKIGAAGPAPEH